MEVRHSVFYYAKRYNPIFTVMGLRLLYAQHLETFARFKGCLRTDDADAAFGCELPECFAPAEQIFRRSSEDLTSDPDPVFISEA